MEACPERDPKLLDFILPAGDRPKNARNVGRCGVAKEEKLELRLGLPGEEDYSLCLLPVKASGHGRAGAYPVVGWPPVRTFRKNFSGSSFNLPTVLPQKDKLTKSEEEEAFRKPRLVKVNMDRMPIGRKIDLEAYRSYDELAAAIDELFQGLLAAQTNEVSSGGRDRRKAFSGPIDGSGDFTLVYEDLEGDVLLVGDVPWDMFVAGVKRLRVMRSSDLTSSLHTVKNGEENSIAAGRR
ncbi:indole-3-acetic acid inducible 18 isoform X2 [Wolffia australiana]